MSRIDNQTPPPPPRTQESSTQNTQAGDSSSFAARFQKTVDHKKQESPNSSSSSLNQSTLASEKSAESMIMQRHGMILGRREGTVADLQAKLEAQGDASKSKGETGGLGEGLLGEGGLGEGLALKGMDAKDMKGSGGMFGRDPEKSLKLEMDGGNLSLDAAQAGKSQFQLGGSHIEGSATIQIQGNRIPTEMLDKMVAHARVGVNATGSPEFQFDLKGDVLGGMKMRMSMEEGQLKAIFIAENPEIRKLIDGNLQDLRRHLEDRGIHIRDLEVRDPEEDRRKRQNDQNNKDREQAWG